MKMKAPPGPEGASAVDTRDGESTASEAPRSVRLTPWPGTPVASPAIDAWLAIWGETFRFAAQRACRNLEAQKEFATCRSPFEVQAVQVRYMSQAATDAREEAGRMSRLVRQLTGVRPPK